MGIQNFPDRTIHGTSSERWTHLKRWFLQVWVGGKATPESILAERTSLDKTFVSQRPQLDPGRKDSKLLQLRVAVYILPQTTGLVIAW